MIARSPGKFALFLFAAVLVCFTIWTDRPWRWQPTYVSQVRVGDDAVLWATQQQKEEQNQNQNQMHVGDELDIHNTETPLAATLPARPELETSSLQPSPLPPNPASLPWQNPRVKSSPLDQESGSLSETEEKAYMEAMLDWPRPNSTAHWPPYTAYTDKAYDPNRWEDFELYVLPFLPSPSPTSRER